MRFFRDGLGWTIHGAITVLLSIILLAGISAVWLVNLTYVGQQYEVVITVQAVEHSSRWGQHTNVWARVYGDQDITYKLAGYVDVEVNKVYRLVFVNQFAVFGFEVWGDVKSVKEILGE